MESKAMNETIERNFTYHKPTEFKQQVYPKLRDKAKELAYLINDLVPDGREKSLAMTKLEEVVMWANAGVSRHKTEEEKQAPKQPEVYAVIKQELYFNGDEIFRHAFREELKDLYDLENASTFKKHLVLNYRLEDEHNTFVTIKGNHETREYLSDWFNFFVKDGGNNFYELPTYPLEV
jgi:hypothetical protein